MEVLQGTGMCLPADLPKELVESEFTKLKRAFKQIKHMAVGFLFFSSILYFLYPWIFRCNTNEQSQDSKLIGLSLC